MCLGNASFIAQGILEVDDCADLDQNMKREVKIARQKVLLLLRIYQEISAIKKL